MTEDVIDQFDTFNTKGCSDELIFGVFNYQPIPSNYYNLLTNYNEDSNTVTGTPVDNALPENKVVEGEVITDNKYLNYEIIIDDDDIFDSDIDPLQK